MHADLTAGRGRDAEDAERVCQSVVEGRRSGAPGGRVGRVLLTEKGQEGR